MSHKRMIPRFGQGYVQTGEQERIEGCFIFSRDEWLVISSALDRFVTGRSVAVKARAKHIAATLFKQIREYVLSHPIEDEYGKSQSASGRANIRHDGAHAHGKTSHSRRSKRGDTDRGMA